MLDDLYGLKQLSCIVPERDCQFVNGLHKKRSLITDYIMTATQRARLTAIWQGTAKYNT